MSSLPAFVSTVSCGIMGIVFTQVGASSVTADVNLLLLGPYTYPPHRVSQKSWLLTDLLLVPFVLINNYSFIQLCFARFLVGSKILGHYLLSPRLRLGELFILSVTPLPLGCKQFLLTIHNNLFTLLLLGTKKSWRWKYPAV